MKRIFSLFLALAMCAMIFSGCNKDNDKSVDGKLKSVPLTWYMVGDAQQDGNLVYGEANKIIQSKLQTTVNFNIIDFGNYDQKMKIILASNDEFDICFTSNWLNNYFQNTQKGAYLPVDDLLTQYAPKLKASIPEKYWDAIKVGGKLYGVINQQIMARSSAVWFTEEFVNKYHFDYKSVKQLSDIEPYLEMVHKDYPELNYTGDLWNEFASSYGFEEFIGDGIPGAIYFGKSGTPVVVNQYESDEWLDYINMRRKWQKLGYTQPNLISLQELRDSSGKARRRVSWNSMTTYKPGGAAEVSNILELDILEQRLSTPLLTTNGVAATLNAISATSKNPERAMMLLELINTDKELYNLLSFGIKDKHYTMLGDNKIKLGPEDKKYLGLNWSVGNVYNSFVMEGQPDDVWEQTEALNDSAEISPLLGFSPEHENVKVQISNCQSVISEFKSTLEQGIGDPAEVQAKFIEKLKLAGVDKVIDEMQNQINIWYANK